MKSALHKIAKSRHKKRALLVCLLCFLGMLLGNLSERFRYSDLHNLYPVCRIGSYLIVLSAIIWSGVNTIEILKEPYHSWKKKIIWALISLAPILLFIGIMFVTFLQEYNAAYIELPNGENQNQ